MLYINIIHSFSRFGSHLSKIIETSSILHLKKKKKKDEKQNSRKYQKKKKKIRLAKQRFNFNI